MAATIPAGSTFFDTLKRSFVDVPITGADKISTSEFLEAVEGVMGLFGMSERHCLRMRRLTPASRCLGIHSIQAGQERHGRQRQGTGHTILYTNASY
jgi:hypothetical protein